MLASGGLFNTETGVLPGPAIALTCIFTFPNMCTSRKGESTSPVALGPFRTCVTWMSHQPTWTENAKTLDAAVYSCGLLRIKKAINSFLEYILGAERGGL